MSSIERNSLGTKKALQDGENQFQRHFIQMTASLQKLKILQLIKFKILKIFKKKYKK